MNRKQTIINEIIDGFQKTLRSIKLSLVDRRIKEVDKWDGAASRWDDTESYCNACLIDVNEAAGRDSKAQSHCMLPVREPGDDEDVYVKQAVYAAAGGRGISRVERPDDVPEEAWNEAVRNAAKKMMMAYEEMEEDAPESLYKIADMEMPEEERKRREKSLSEMVDSIRAAFSKLYNSSGNYYYWVISVYDTYILVQNEGQSGVTWYQVGYSIDENGNVLFDQMVDWVEGKMEFTPNAERAMSVQTIYSKVFDAMMLSETYLMDLFHEGQEMFAIGNRNGKLYKMAVMVDGDNVMLGEEQQVTIDFPPVEGRSLSVTRQSDGRYRWMSLSCTAILNRSGEIDTSKLFDSFIARLDDEGYPQLDFYHIPGTDMGTVDFVARDGFVLITSVNDRLSLLGHTNWSRF